MTKRLKKARKLRSAKKARSANHRAASKLPSNPLDDFIVVAARSVDIKIDERWMADVRSNFEVTLRLGALVAAFPLPDEIEPAPVFSA